MMRGFQHVLTGRPFRWVIGIVAGLLALYLALGYFAVDPDTRPGRLVFNRTVGLRDSWAKAQKG